MTRAERACASARILLDAGDPDGACNRAYYAMFDAAKAMLLSVDAPTPARGPKTHRGLISAFGQHLVKPGRIPAEFGRMLNWAEDIRLVADYEGDPIEHGVAAEMVESAEAFTVEMRSRFQH